MTDYSETPFEPIVQGVVTFVAGAPVFNGRGVSAIGRIAGFPVGAYVLQLDEGLPGNNGAVPPGANAILNPNVRSMIQPRGIPPNIFFITVAYPISLIPGVGSDRIFVVMANALGGADSVDGFEIITWLTE